VAFYVKPNFWGFLIDFSLKGKALFFSVIPLVARMNRMTAADVFPAFQFQGSRAGSAERRGSGDLAR